MVIGGAEFLSIGRIEDIRLLHFLPAEEVLDGACGAAVAVEVDIKEHVLAAKALYVEGHEIVDFVGGQFHIERLCDIVVDDDPDVGNLLPLLYREQQVAVGNIDTQHGMIVAQHLRRLCPSSSGHDHYHQRGKNTL